MTDIFVTMENICNLRNFQEFTQTNSKILDRNYFLQGTSDMEPDSGKIKGIGNIKQMLKGN